jgi:peroxiredoxin
MKILFLLISLTQIALAQHGKGLKPLALGSTAPSFSAINQDSILVKSSDLLSKGPIVLIFYRGAWCPYCQRHIHEIQEGFQQILDKKASVVVVTPEKSEYIEKMISKTGATFSLLHDTNYEIMSKYNVKYTIQKKDKMAFKTFLVPLVKKHNKDSEAILPIPATYIIGKEGKIKYVHFDADYKNRSSLEEILKNL